MLKDVTLGQFLPGNSCIHRLDPRTKLLLTIAYVVAVFLVKGAVGYLLPLAYLLLVTRLAGISLRYLLKGVRPLTMILIITFFFNLFFSQGTTVLLTLGPLRLTQAFFSKICRENSKFFF